MKKRILIVVFSVLLAVGTLGLASCANDVIKQNEAAGYTVVVNFDTGGGTLAGNEKVSLTDMYKPSNYTADENGYVHIKIVDPVDSKRPFIGYDDQTNPYPLTKLGHMLLGWYRTRTEITDEAGNVTYSYADKWDFANDTIDCKADDKKVVEVKLYAAWIEFYRFEYYYENADGVWEQYDKTDIAAIPSELKGTEDEWEARMYLPYWDDGAVEYTTSLGGGRNYSFPKVANKTFEAAYTDEACTQKIDLEPGEYLYHNGSLDENGVAQTSVYKIYVKFLDGDLYKIDNADQFVKYATANGYYEISADLDFTGKTWPAALVNGTFTGKIYGKETGKTYRFTNISAKFNSASATKGGLFGAIAKTSQITDIAFENVTFDYVTCGARKTDISFGLFSGEIEEGANLKVSLTSAEMRIGGLQAFSGGYSFNLLANGDTSGITADVTKFGLVVYGEKNEYLDFITYKVNPEMTKVDAEGKITIQFTKTLEEEQRFKQESYIIQERR